VDSELYVGLMSGTSMDGVDVVVVSIDSKRIELVASYAHPIPIDLRQQLLNICNDQHTTLAEIGRIDHKLGKLYATAVVEILEHAKLSAEQITAIGNHGQTVFHHPEGESPFTLQLGDANLIAALTGIDTIADFRRIDMALGGQGAPLTPAFHQFLFNDCDSTVVVLNIGGISNISVIPANGTTIGFDTGPGNLLLDAWSSKHTGKAYDQDAQWASQGRTDTALLKQLLRDPYLAKAPPKSTGREHYHLGWLEKQLVEKFAAHDVQRTLCEFTVASIAQQVNPFKQGPNCELLVCGGGANNPLLMRRLQQALPQWQVLRTAERGIPGDYMEAMAFAWFARQRIHNQPSNLPTVTGANRRASLGVIFPAVKAFSRAPISDD